MSGSVCYSEYSFISLMFGDTKFGLALFIQLVYLTILNIHTVRIGRFSKWDRDRLTELESLWYLSQMRPNFTLVFTGYSVSEWAATFWQLDPDRGDWETFATNADIGKNITWFNRVTIIHYFWLTTEGKQ